MTCDIIVVLKNWLFVFPKRKGGGKEKMGEKKVLDGVRFVDGVLHLWLQPALLGNVQEGVNLQLESFLLKYIRKLDGVVLAFSNVKVLDSGGKIYNDQPQVWFFFSSSLCLFPPPFPPPPTSHPSSPNSPLSSSLLPPPTLLLFLLLPLLFLLLPLLFLLLPLQVAVRVRARFLVFTAEPGQTMAGVVSNVGFDHVGVIVHGIFNASFPCADTSVYEVGKQVR